MKILAFSLFIFCFAAPAQAQVFAGPISSALGGTGRAGMNSSESAFLNPALVPLLNNYEINGYFRDGYQDAGQHLQAWGVGAADNGPDVSIPGSLHYIRTRKTGLSAQPADGELWHVALGRLVYDRFSVGISGYRLKYEMQTGASTTQWNYSLGGLWMFSRELGIAYVLDNLANPGSNVPQALREDLKQSIGAMAGFSDIARLRLDLSRNEKNNPDKKLIYMLGLESMSSEFFLVRIGLKKDDQHDRTFWTAGLGFNGPRLKVDYSFEKNQERTSGALHSVDLRLPF